MMKTLILFFSAIYASTCFSADWVFISSTGKEDFYIDKSSYNYRKNNNTVDIWEKTIDTTPNNPYISTKSLSQYDCVNKRAKYLEYAEFYSNGDPIQKRYKKNEYAAIYPDSVGEGLWRAVCATRGKGIKSIYKSEKDRSSEILTQKLVSAYDAKNAKKPIVLDSKIADAYYGDKLPPVAREALENDIRNGLVELPY
ncbi:MAG TPA: hypothetical protein DIT34_04015 [Acinetobacter ursingii]|nr:hypothetical protein [Acinetobacter ursingii]